MSTTNFGPTSLNPDWTEDETLLALEAYLRVRPRFPHPQDEVIQELSGLLKVFAAQRGVVGSRSFRNPFGVSRKVGKFRAAESGRPPSEVRGAGLEAKIWNRYLDLPDAAMEAAARIRLRIYQTEVENEVALQAVSRGPPPSFGERKLDVTDGDCVVYVLLLAPTEN